MQKKHTILAVGALVLILGAAAIWHYTRPPQRSVYGISAISSDEAVLLTRIHAGNYSQRTFVEKVHVSGERGWETELTPLKPMDSFGRSGVTFDSSQIYVLTYGVEGMVVVALGLDDGDERWRQTLGAKEDEVSQTSTLLIDGDRLLTFHQHQGDNTQVNHMTVTALATDTGAIAWPLAGEPRYFGRTGLEGKLIAPGTLVLSGAATRFDALSSEFKGLRIDSANGKLRQALPFTQAPCITSNGVYGFIDGVLHGARWRGGKFDPPVPISGLLARALRVPTNPCAAYGGLTIMGVDVPHADEGFDTNPVLLAIDANTNVIRWTRTFEQSRIFPYTWYAGDVWPRFVPIVTLFRAGSPDTFGVAVVDLDTGDIVSERASKSPMNPIVTPTRAFINDDATATLIGFDPTTGAPTTPLPGSNYIKAGPAADDVLDGRLWHFRAGEALPGDLPWTVVDLATWTVIHDNGEPIPRQPALEK